MVGAFEPSQPQRIKPGQNTNFSLSPKYSFPKSLYHKSFFLEPQLKFYPQFRNAKPEEEKKERIAHIIMFREHSTREPVFSRMTYFILRAYTGTSVSHSQRRKNSGEVLEKMHVNGQEGKKLARKKSLAVSVACMAIY